MYTRLNAYINGGKADFYTAFIGANSIFACCSKIRTQNPSWNGKLYIRVEPATDAKWTSQLLGMYAIINNIGISFLKLHLFLS